MADKCIWNNCELTRYEIGRISVLLPSILTVTMENETGFLAEGPEHDPSLLVEVDVDHVIVEAQERTLRGPPGNNSMLKTRIIRQQPIENPYSGYEPITEHSSEHAPTDFGWDLGLKRNGEYFLIGLQSIGIFEEHEEHWRKVIDSLRIAQKCFGRSLDNPAKP